MRRWVWRGAVIAAVTGVVGAGVWGGVTVDRLDRDLDEARADLIAERRAREDADAAVDRTAAAVVRTLGDRIADLEQRMGTSPFDDLSSRVDELDVRSGDLDAALSQLNAAFAALERTVGQPSFATQSLARDVENLRRCINEGPRRSLFDSSRLVWDC